MPQAIPLAVGLGASATAGAAAAAGTATFIGLNAVAWSAISVGLSIAGTLAQTLLAEQPPKPKMQDGDVSIKQAIPPRTRMYGRQRLGGVYLYYDSTPDGDLKTLVCHAAHECDDSMAGAPNPEEHWLNDEQVQIDKDGNVKDDPWWQEGSGLGGDDGHSAVVIRNYLGVPTQQIPTFDEKWTVDHKAHGLCCTYVKYADLKDEDQIKVFPSGPPPYRIVLRGAKVFDPRLQGTDPGEHDPDDEASWAWSDNAALVILDYLTRLERDVPVGFGIPLAGPAGCIDLASFAAAADVCDQLVALKAGGAEKRWRAWGAYELTEDKKAVLQDLLDACGGRLIQGPEGKLGLTVGAPGPAAAVTLTEEQILEWDLNQGKPAIERINEVRATYVSQAWEWAETEAGIQLDQAAIDRNGVESSQIKLRFVPSESQAQRVAREVLRRGNSSHAGRIRTTLAGLDAWGERWIRLQIAELGIDTVFEITSMRLNQADMTVELEVTSYDSWWEWNAATDEQAPAVPPPDGDDDAGVPVPDTVSVTIAHRFYNAQTPVAVGVITWGPPPRSVYVAKARYRKVSADPQNPFPWQPLPVAQDDDQVETFPLQDGTAYEAQVRFIGPRGAGSDWSTPPATFTAVADPVAPASPANLTAQANAPATGQVTVSATAPNDPRHLSLRFYRNSSSSFAGATLINGPLYCAPLSAQTYIDMPAAGDWWYFATSSNWSNVASAPAGGVTAEVSPAAPVITTPPGPISSHDRRPAVSGHGAVPGAAIKLFANAMQVGTGTAAGDGAWTVTPSADLGIGANGMTATQTAGGNESVASGAVTITVVAIDADAWSYIAAMTMRPDFARQTLIKNLVDSLKTAGVWAKLDALYLLAAHDAQAAKLNAKAPGSFALTAVSSPVFTVDRGYKGTGAGTMPGGYLSTGFNPSTAGGHYALNDAHLSVWVRTPSSSTTNGAMSEAGNANAFISSKNATPGTIVTRENDNVSTGVAAGTPNSIELFCLCRTGFGAYSRYHNAASLGDLAQASTSIFNDTFYLLRRGATTYSDAQISTASFGSALTPTQEGDFYTALHTYLVEVGAA
ncbi:phage tail protein [Inquilinus sp. YAF38]|uniref:phage tail protein n=1 Tax=Inquilinus sp. YAF38 TaxID=3233084 RepID=UPI003F8F68B6